MVTHLRPIAFSGAGAGTGMMSALSEKVELLNSMSFNSQHREITPEEPNWHPRIPSVGKMEQFCHSTIISHRDYGKFTRFGRNLFRSLGLAACASLESKNEVCLLCEVNPKQIPAFDFICASLESILAIEDTWERGEVICVLRISGFYTSRLLDAACKKVLNLLKKGLLVYGEAKTTSTPTSPTTQAQVTYVSESVSYLKFEAKTFNVNEELRKVCWWEIVRRRPMAATKDHMISSYDVLIIQNIRVISFTMKMEILLEPTSNKLIVERFYTSAGNLIKEILLKLNLPDHRILKDGGEVKEFQRSFRHSDTERLSRSDEVLKLKNFKKDATLKLSKSTNQEWYEHVGPEVTR
ncbi:hypothetical protein Tco_1378924 [Tanacetum coccineum]